MKPRTIAPKEGKLTACDMIDLLRAKYPLPAYALLEQVADGTGARQTRWADAVVMSVWPSRGYWLTGFEVKVSRSDWMHELRKPEKADAIMRYCNDWYLCVSDPNIVQPGELPSTWGLMAVKGGRLTVITEAPKLTPMPFSPELFASLIRNLVVTEANQLSRVRNEGVEQGKQEALAVEGRSWQMQSLCKLRDQVEAFELASGIKINGYADGKELGEAVAVLRNLRWTQLDNALRTAQGVVEQLSKLAAVEVMQKLREEAEAVKL